MALFKRIDRKLLFSFLTITILLLVIITFTAYYRAVNETKKQTINHLRQTAIALKGHLNTFLTSQKNIARDFASDRHIINSLKDLSLPYTDRASIVKQLNEHITLNKMSLYSPRILGIRVLNHEGIVVFATNKTTIGADTSNKDYFAMVKSEGFLGDIHFSETFFEPVFEVSAPIIDKKTGDFHGVIVNTMSGSSLADITRSHWIEEYEKVSTGSLFSAYYYGTSKNDNAAEQKDDLPFSNSTEDIYIVNGNKKMITVSRFQENAVLKQEVDTEPVRKALNDGEEMVGIYDDYRGESIIGASIYVGELKWVILAEKDVAETFAPLFRLKAQLITLGIVAFGIVIFVSSVVARKISLPIRNLSIATIKRAEGDMGHRLEETDDDELGALSSSFNKMCDDIQKVTVSKDYMEKVFHGIHESLIITGINFEIKKINPATLDMLGYKRDEDLIDKPVSTIFAKDMPFLDALGLQELIKHDHALINHEGAYKAKNGENVPVNISASIIRECKHKKHPDDCPNFSLLSSCSSCKAVNIVIVARDMRQINALIQKERERVFELKTIQEISMQLGYTLNYDDLFKLILNPLHTAINFDIAGAVLCNDPDDLIYIRHTKPIGNEMLGYYKNSLMETFIKLSGNNHKECRKEIVDITGQDLADKDGSPAVNEQLNDKIKSYFNVPLIVKGNIVGIINISSFNENAFEANHIRMLYTVANQVTISIQHLISLIEHEKGKLASILRDMVDGVIMIDPRGVIDMVNPAGEKLLKPLSVSKQGEPIAHLGDYFLKEPMQLVLSNKKDYISQKLTITNEMGQMTFSMILAPIRGEGQNVGVVIVLRDVTNETNLQQQLLHAEKLSTIGEMVSGIAHEINNPLAGVMGLTQLLQIQPGLSDNVRKNVDKIFSYTDRARRIIQNLLTFARAHKPEKIPVAVNQLIEQTIEMHEYNMKTNDIEIVKDFDMRVPEIIADMYQLQQVYFNIINNAYQALVEYDGKKVFTVATKIQGEFIITSLHNSGQGISNDIIKKMFNPFFTTKEVGKGTGMGLSVSYGIIKEHDGDIYVTSKKGEGVTFYVKLPLKSEGFGEISAVHKIEEAVTKVPNMNILIVDDEKTVADSISSLLQTEGHLCDVAMKVDDAIDKLAANSYDIIISDVKMPGLGGKEFYAYIKLHKPDLEKRFIAVTGDVMNPDTKSFVEDNNIICITKPFTFNDLKVSVAKASNC